MAADHPTDRLAEYRQKRRSERTPEPPGAPAAPAAPERRFVIQRHAARRLHYDLRLEDDGVLLSWAIPRGLPLTPSERHLAIQTEDHPLEYLTFEGRIPEGEYGAGSLEVWDAGVYEIVERKTDGGLSVHLSGGRRHGTWTLVPAALDGNPANWLVLRKQHPSEPLLPAEQEVLLPMLSSARNQLPRGEGWCYEVKWDGYRAIARLSGGEATLVSRQGSALTERFAEVARALPWALRTPDCLLDGELVALDQAGRPSFSMLQSGEGTAVYYVFDLLAEDRTPMLEATFDERRARLIALLDADASRLVRLSEAVTDGLTLLAFAGEQGLEGVMAKRRVSRYRPGQRSADWVKVKLRQREEFVIVGYTTGSGQRTSSLGALILATHAADGLRWVGNCGTGFDDTELRRLVRLLAPLRRADSPLADASARPRRAAAEVVWVEPRHACEVEFAELTREGRLRAPSYRGLRDGEARRAVRRDVAAATSPSGRSRNVGSPARPLTLTNLDKVFWPGEGIRKGDLLAYYEAVAPVIVPHLADRLFTMKRFPNGIEEKHFFQKHAPTHMPAWIARRSVETVSRGSGKERRIDYPVVGDELALLWMVNMGCIDMNVTLSRIDRLDRPDVVLFDLDPTPEAGFAGAVAVARLVRAALDALGLVGYPKTSGSDGIHVLVPISRRHGYADTRLLAATVAGALARTYPDLVTTEFLRERRRGVLIDANQNGEGRTIASAYSVRPHPGAPVSTPLDWAELTDDLDPRAFTMDVVLQRVASHGDLAAGALAGGQSIASALRELG